MPNNCPICHQPGYESGEDPIYGQYVLCQVHGIQICGELPKQAKYRGGTTYRATPILDSLDGDTK